MIPHLSRQSSCGRHPSVCLKQGLQGLVQSPINGSWAPSCVQKIRTFPGITLGEGTGVVRLVAALFSHLHFKLDQQDVLGCDSCGGWMTFPFCLPCSRIQILAFCGILGNSRITFTPLFDFCSSQSPNSWENLKKG